MANRPQTNPNTVDRLDSIALELNLSPPNENLNPEARIRELQDRIHELEGASGNNVDYSEEIAELEELRSQVERSIVQVTEREWRFQRFKMNAIELKPPPDFSEEEFNALGDVLSGMGTAVQFWLGDWANLYIGDEENEQKRGEYYQYLSERFNIKRRTLQNYASVCRALEPSLRREGVTFSIHREVAELPEILKGKESTILDWAMTNDATVRELQEYISIMKQAKLGGARKSSLITDDSWLFGKKRKPRINLLQKLWGKSQNGDVKAEVEAREEIAKMRKWLDALEDSMK